MNVTAKIESIGSALAGALSRILSRCLTLLGAPESTPMNIRLECANNNYRAKVKRAK